MGFKIALTIPSNQKLFKGLSYRPIGKIGNIGASIVLFFSFSNLDLKILSY